jgi:N-acetylglutamate synthase-like GNAT family acetyltransferase
MNRLKQVKVSQLEIIHYDDALAIDFAALNKAWLQKYFVVEPIDEIMLEHPKHYFIDKGGFIFFAKLDDKVAGTVALLKVSEGIFELSKMAVSEEFQGRKIGNKLVEHCIEVARELKVKKVILYSNTKLENAIHLFRKFGFIEVPLDEVEYKRANIKMEMDIK